MSYQIQKELGEGSFGIVYLLHLPNRRQYALKVIKLINPAVSELARRESELMLGLKHPHILHCHWVGIHQRQLLFLLLEYCERGTLTNAIKEVVSEEQAMTWFIQMADALKYLHSKKVMHRDIKPDNILLDQSNHIKVGDLGVARMQEFTAQGGGTFAGTECYMSPQILQGEPYKDKTDIWSLGCVFHEVLSKRPPFSRMDLLVIIRGPTPSMPLTYSEGLRNFILKVLDRNEMTRPTAERMFQDLIQLRGRPYYPITDICQQKENVDTEGVAKALQHFERTKHQAAQTAVSGDSSTGDWLLAGAVGLAAAAAAALLITRSSNQSNESDNKKHKH